MVNSDKKDCFKILRPFFPRLLKTKSFYITLFQVFYPLFCWKVRDYIDIWGKARYINGMTNANTVFLINDLLADRDSIPFDTNKDVVIIGRGGTRYKYTFNLKYLNLFYLNMSPGCENKSIEDFYRNKFRKDFKKSFFSFVHKAHFKKLLEDNKICGRIITWKAPIDSRLMVPNIYPKACRFFGEILHDKNIYMIGVDFDEEQPVWRWKGEKDGVKTVIKECGIQLEKENCNGKCKYIFLSPNRYFHSYMTPGMCQKYVDILKEKKYILNLDEKKEM